MVLHETAHRFRMNHGDVADSGPPGERDIGDQGPLDNDLNATGSDLDNTFTFLQLGHIQGVSKPK